MKFLIWAAVAAIVVYWLTRGKRISSDADSSKRPAAPSTETATEPMVQCVHCGMHVPTSESVTAPSGKVFCSEEHRLLYGKS